MSECTVMGGVGRWMKARRPTDTGTMRKIRLTRFQGMVYALLCTVVPFTPGSLTRCPQRAITASLPDVLRRVGLVRTFSPVKHGKTFPSPPDGYQVRQTILKSIDV